MPNATGEEKFQAALTQLSGMLLAQGITLGVGILRVCIEMAYRKMMATPEVVEEAKMLQSAMTIPAEPIQQVQP